MVEREQQWRGQARRAMFDDYRQRHTAAWIAPQGNSMRPLIGPDTWLQVEFGAPAYGVGEIILFPLGDLIVAHRVVAIKASGEQTAIIAKGDAEPYPDPPIASAQILGAVRLLRRGETGTGTTFGCAGRSARLIAAISRAHGLAASALRRVATLLPAPTRRVVLNAIPPFLRAVARVLLAPLSWATLRDPSLNKSGRR